MFYFVHSNLNDEASTNKGQTKASSTFQIMINNDLIDFFLCKWNFSVIPFTLKRYYSARTAKKNFQYYTETDQRKSSVKKLIFLPCDVITFFTDSGVPGEDRK